MGWNGSDQKETPQAVGAQGASQATAVKAIVSLFVVALIGLAVYFFLGRDAAKPAQENTAKKQAPIAAVKPAVSAPAVAPTNEPPVRMKTVRHPITGVEKRVPYVPPKINSNNVSYIGQPIPGNIVNPPRRLFKHRSLGMLAGLVNVKPGATIVGIELPRNFDQDFKDALANERIEVLPEDTPEEAETKRMVSEMVEDCKQILAEGGSVREAVMEERNYLRKVADIRFTLQKEISKMRREGASEAEISDAVTAANQIMKEYGDVKIRVSPFRTNKQEANK